MRIVNKSFHDFYDSCMGFGVDEELVYVRITQEIETREFTHKTKEDFAEVLKLVERKRYDMVIEHRFESKEHKDGKGRNHSFSSGFIGFCGIIYPYIKIDRTRIKSLNLITEFIYKEQEVLDYIRNYGLGKQQRRYAYYLNEDVFDKKYLNKFFTKHQMQDVFFNIGNPIFVINSTGIKINPNLQEYNFYKVQDSFTAFQEISMFLGGVLGKAHPPMDQISDKDMKIKKGFGDLSFKNQCHKRKSKR